MAAEESVEELVIKINKAPALSLTRTIKEIIKSETPIIIQQIINHPDLLSPRKAKLEKESKLISVPIQPVIEKDLAKRMTLNVIPPERTNVAGSLPIVFYDDLQEYKPIDSEVWEGSTGDAFIYRRPHNPMKGMYIVKKMIGEMSWTLDRVRNNSQRIMSSKIIDILHEMNTNLEVTEKIGYYVSKCMGTYLSYRFTDHGGKFTAYFVFEYLPGMTLDKWIKDNKNKNSYPEMAEKIKESLRGCVGALSDIGYVHRDLKPKNVYVVLNGDQVERCILIDFGEALVIGTRKPIENILGNSSKSSDNSSNFSENERFDPIKANTAENKFINRYQNVVIPEQNMISLKRIITYPTNRGGLGLSEGGLRRKLRTKKNKHRKHRTRRSA